jgi:hypothetical protein
MSGRFAHPRLAPLAALLAASLLSPPRPARAEPPKTGEFSTQLNSITAGAEVGTGIQGYSLVGEVSPELQGGHSFDGRRVLVLWNCGTQLIGGVVANEHPFTPVVGLRASAGGTFGLRLIPPSLVSPFVGVGLDVSGHAVRPTGTPLTQVNTLNNLGEFGGVAGDVRNRLYAGGSILDATHSFLFLAFVEQQLSSARTFATGKSFAGGGLRVQYDVAHDVTAGGEAAILTTGQTQDPALSTASTTTRWAISGDVLKKFGEHFVVGLDASLSRDATTSSSGAAVFDTVSPIDATFTIKAGYTP